jgi:hypothetical protein
LCPHAEVLRPWAQVLFSTKCWEVHIGAPSLLPTGGWARDAHEAFWPSLAAWSPKVAQTQSPWPAPPEATLPRAHPSLNPSQQEAVPPEAVPRGGWGRAQLAMTGMQARPASRPPSGFHLPGQCGPTSKAPRRPLPLARPPAGKGQRGPCFLCIQALLGPGSGQKFLRPPYQWAPAGTAHSELVSLAPPFPQKSQPPSAAQLSPAANTTRQPRELLNYYSPRGHALCTPRALHRLSTRQTGLHPHVTKPPLHPSPTRWAPQTSFTSLVQQPGHSSSDLPIPRHLCLFWGGHRGALQVIPSTWCPPCVPLQPSLKGPPQVHGGS